VSNTETFKENVKKRRFTSLFCIEDETAKLFFIWLLMNFHNFFFIFLFYGKRERERERKKEREREGERKKKREGISYSEICTIGVMKGLYRPQYSP
jgi:hypothetical protein